MKIFVSGGCKNGKSMYAQKLAKDMADEQNLPLYYVATMMQKDEEDRARILRHRDEREGWGFETVEIAKNISNLAEKEGIDIDGVFLIDSITALLENEIFDAEYNLDKEAGSRVATQLSDLLEQMNHAVLVSDYIYDNGNYSHMTEDFRRALALIDRKLAECCDSVYEVVAGIPVKYK